MSLFQCENCGCCENTALSFQGFRGIESSFDWTGIEHLRGKKICSACGPSKYRDGTPAETGVWHGQFDRVFLPMGMFTTNKVGNLAHKDTGDENYRDYELVEPEAEPERYDELWGADPNCKHEVVAQPRGGVKCKKCPGWFCY